MKNEECKEEDEATYLESKAAANGRSRCICVIRDNVELMRFRRGDVFDGDECDNHPFKKKYKSTFIES